MALSKLYPPIIGTRIPAFYQDDNDSLIINVPFEDNRAVSTADYDLIYLRIKTVQNDVVCLTATATHDDIENGVAHFVVPKDIYQKGDKWLVNLGQYYQVQLAYLDKGSLKIGYYSSVGITKFSSLPVMSIDGLEEGQFNNHIYNYVGKYSQYDGEYWDTTEKVYNYKFIITNSDDSIIYDTGWLLHDSSKDENYYESEDSFAYVDDLEEGGKIQYLVETNSGIVAASPVQELTGGSATESIEAPEVKLNFDDGFVTVKCGNIESDGYCIIREGEDGIRHKVHNIEPYEEQFEDLTVEQGIKYNYYIYKYENDAIAAISQPANVWVDFEDILISDASGRQLKLRYNPNVNSMKYNILENKIDTIGGQYPTFSRNGNVKYKDFSISGLISFHIDEDNYKFMEFDKDQEESRESTKTENGFTKINAGYIYRKERLFREAVNDWLTNGEIKYYRSAQEGNHLVRIMNVSFSPFQNTSRLVWSVSGNAIEAAGNNYSNLLDNGFYNISLRGASEQEKPLPIAEGKKF